MTHSKIEPAQHTAAKVAGVLPHDQQRIIDDLFKILIVADDTDQEAREAIRRGVKQLARAVKVTLGPRGRNVVIQKSFGSPRVTLELAPPRGEQETLEELRSIARKNKVLRSLIGMGYAATITPGYELATDPSLVQFA
jgi:hypothetical protein